MHRTLQEKYFEMILICNLQTIRQQTGLEYSVGGPLLDVCFLCQSEIPDNIHHRTKFYERTLEEGELFFSHYDVILTPLNQWWKNL